VTASRTPNTAEARARTRPGARDRAGPQPPRSFNELAGMLQARLATLSDGHARIARQVLSDPEGCAFMTITELATAVGVNESTVVRFASKLGLDGYPALTALCRERLREQAQLVGRFERLQELADRDGRRPPETTRRVDRLSSPLESLAVSDQRNIVRTFARVDRKDWRRAVKAAAHSRNVYVIGLRKCYAVAYLLSYLLGLIRDDVRHVASEAGTLADAVRQVGPRDTFIAVSIHRYTRETVRALRFAHSRGACTIALTDNAASPLAQHADVSLYIDTSSSSVLRSVSAFVSLVQAFAAAVAVERGTKARSALLLEEDVLREFEVYEVDASQTAETPE
jgi:DNA-binding MurR/RpiR family transcriptional regulator